MSVELRLFDETHDLAGVVNLYNDVFAPMRPYYSWPLAPERFTDRVLQHWEYRREGLWVALDGPRLVGCVVANTRLIGLDAKDAEALKTPHAFISVIAVHPAYRRRGLGRRLYDKAEAFARRHACVDITPACNPAAPMAFFIAPRADWLEALAFFNALGFDQTDTTQNMVRSIVDFSPAAATADRIRDLTRQGYECRLYTEHDYRALLQLLDGGYPYWTLDMLSKVGRWTQTRPFMETCFMDCSTEEIAGPDEIGIVVKDGRILSYCAQTISRAKRTAYLGPMLTVPDARGLGLGTVALQLSVQSAARKGAVVCDVWTGSDAHRTRFYGKSGFRPWMRWMGFSKPLVPKTTAQPRTGP